MLASRREQSKPWGLGNAIQTNVLGELGVDSSPLSLWMRMWCRPHKDCLVALSHGPSYIVPELLAYRKREVINGYVFKLLNA